jgi:hypothetical protein
MTVTVLERIGRIGVVGWRLQANYPMRHQVGEAGRQAGKIQAITAENEALKPCGVPLSRPLLMIYESGMAIRPALRPTAL